MTRLQGLSATYNEEVKQKYTYRGTCHTEELCSLWRRRRHRRGSIEMDRIGAETDAAYTL